jgi:hypothetical protein
MRSIFLLVVQQQAPGLTINFEEGAGTFRFAVGIEADGEKVGDGFNRDDVPGVVRSDVGGDEVNVVAGIVNVAAVGVAADDDGKSVEVAAAVSGEAGLDLDAEQAAPVLEEEVVRVAFAEGAGHAEAKTRGLVGESEFGELATALVAELVG